MTQPLLVECERYESCGGYCAQGDKLCPKCQKDATAKALREASDRHIEHALEKLENKPHKPDYGYELTLRDK